MRSIVLSIIIMLLTSNAFCDSTNLKIAVLLPSSGEDLSWSQSFLTSIKNVCQTQNFQLDFQENILEDDASQHLKEYIDNGYNIIIAHGSQYKSGLTEIAKQHKEVLFLIGGTAPLNQETSNIITYNADNNQSGYINGIISSLLTKTNSFGIVVPLDSESAPQYVEGFISGVKTTLPEADIQISYTSDYNDIPSAYEAAKLLTSQGCDILTGISQQSIGALKFADANNIYWLGVQYDQLSKGPSSVVLSMVYRWEDILKEIIDSYLENTTTKSHYTIKLDNHGIQAVFNKSLAIYPDLKEVYLDIVKAITEDITTSEESSSNLSFDISRINHKSLSTRSAHHAQHL